MKTISLTVSDKTAAVIKRMNEEELKKLKEKLELYVSNPVDELFEVMDEASEYAGKKGLTPEKLANILEIDMAEMNRNLGRDCINENIMETVIRIRTNELTPDFFNKIKALFNKEEELEISISPVSDFGLNKKESREEYVNRVNKAIRNLDKQTSNVSLSDSDFENLTNDLLAAK